MIMCEKQKWCVVIFLILPSETTQYSPAAEPRNSPVRSSGAVFPHNSELNNSRTFLFYTSVDIYSSCCIVGNCIRGQFTMHARELQYTRVGQWMCLYWPVIRCYFPLWHVRIEISEPQVYIHILFRYSPRLSVPQLVSPRERRAALPDAKFIFIFLQGLFLLREENS